MYLKKIEISGFKSFAKRTTLEFLPSCHFHQNSQTCGITAIVGPNGSGKSNVADAVRWAMGEQSMKALRGKKSEDVIFAGSHSKAKLGSAFVSLTFDNSDKKIPLEFGEVKISRRMFRNGESEYFINDSRVRLVDVIDLLAKAGIGRESYCVVNQGSSDSVLNASPSERRIILEDAAGVKQYQIKKERAERKLEATRNNLIRVEGLIEEVKPHLRTLKRQAERALKSRDYANELREKQIRLFSFLWQAFQSERENISAEKKEIGIQMMNKQREVDKIADELARASRNSENFSFLEELERQREDLREEVNNAEKNLVISEGRLEIEKEKMMVKEIVERMPVDAVYVSQSLEKIRKNHEELIRRLTNIESLDEIQDIKEFARAIQQELHDLYAEVKAGSVEQKKDLSVAPQQREKIEKLKEDCEKYRNIIAEARKKLEGVENQISRENEKNKEQRLKFFEMERILRRKQDELGKLKDLFNEAKVKLAKVEVKEEDLTREIREELKMGPNELPCSQGEINENELRREIARLKVHLEQAGGIDPLVIDEYEETRKRYEFLTKETEDLKSAIKSCKEVMSEMDKKIKDVFDEAFEKINKEFTKYFRIIFGGGNAHLIKTKMAKTKIKIEEEKDLNAVGTVVESDVEAQEQEIKEEIGIDIFACPPGKRISHLNMLSGGERSLTAIALLFAIISHNPPPFAVLDEVEAALDEANSRRFGRILRELSHQTQFIIITHNRETMRQASLLYGVTMTEDGVSKLLSVKLDQAEEVVDDRK